MAATFYWHRVIESWLGEYEWVFSIGLLVSIFVVECVFYFMVKAALRLENEKIINNYIVVKRPRRHKVEKGAGGKL